MLLAQAFLRRFAQEHGRNIRGFSEDAIAAVLYEENIIQIPCRTSDAVQPDGIVDDRAQRYGLLGLADLAY